MLANLFSNQGIFPATPNIVPTVIPTSAQPTGQNLQALNSSSLNLAPVSQNISKNVIPAPSLNIGKSSTALNIEKSTEGWEDDVFNQGLSQYPKNSNVSSNLAAPASPVLFTTLEPQIIKQLPNLPSGWTPVNYILGGQSSDPSAEPEYVIDIRPFVRMDSMISPEGLTMNPVTQQSVQGSTQQSIPGAMNTIVAGSVVTGNGVAPTYPPILSIPLNVTGNETIAGQSVGGSLLSMLIPAITNPSTISGLVNAGQVGIQGIAALRQGKQLKDANDPEKAYQPYVPAGSNPVDENSEPSLSSGEVLDGQDETAAVDGEQKGNKGKNKEGDKENGKFLRFLACQENGQGLCCVMPDFCHPWADCSSSIDNAGQNGGLGLVTDVLSAVPRCQCKPGFIGDGKAQGTGCSNANECERQESGCMHTCTDLSPGYACGCHEGFTLGSDMMSCQDIDECADGTALCSHKCLNTEGAYFCECEPGYILLQDGVTCQEIDECALMVELAALPVGTADVPAELYDLYPACEVIELCANTIGGYTCNCPEGFKLAEDELNCEDINECEANPDLCPSNSKCLNEYGSYQCICSKGFVASKTISDLYPLIPTNSTQVVELTKLHQDLTALYAAPDYCADINECDLSTSCPVLSGSFSPICVNEQGTYSCSCKTKAPEKFLQSYVTSPLPDKSWPLNDQYSYHLAKGCALVDSCAGDVCGNNASCDSSTKPALCTCNPGFQLQMINGQFNCMDVDECSLKKPLLAAQKLFSPNDEFSYPGGCLFACENLPGSFKCGCPSGYLIGDDPGQCNDIDECSQNACNGGCVNYPGGYQCSCPPGFASRSGSDLGDEAVSAMMSQKEKEWLKTKTNDAYPLSSENIAALWKSAISELMCKPIIDLCQAKLGNGKVLGETVCDSDQICSSLSSETAASFTSIAEFMNVIQCNCNNGYSPGEKSTPYSSEIEKHLGLVPGIGKYSKGCIDVDECEIAKKSIYWGESDDSQPLCKKNKPCCVNTEGAYTCNAKKKGSCAEGIDLY